MVNDAIMNTVVHICTTNHNAQVLSTKCARVVQLHGAATGSLAGCEVTTANEGAPAREELERAACSCNAAVLCGVVRLVVSRQVHARADSGCAAMAARAQRAGHRKCT